MWFFWSLEKAILFNKTKFKKSSKLWLIEETKQISVFKTIIGIFRLSIRDLSSNGNQPMDLSKIRYCFNGGAEELKKINYNSSSDTEVLVNLYAK